MLNKPGKVAFKALLWFVILFVPGGLLLLAFLAADTVHRRHRGHGAAPESDLPNAPLSSAGSLRS
jgi:hypothetical protein